MARVVALLLGVLVLGGMGVLSRVGGPTGDPITGAAPPSPGISAVAYALGSPTGDGSSGLVAIEVASGRVLGRFGDVRRQGGGLAFASDGLHAYLLDGPYLHELELPSLRELRSAELPDAVTPLGHAQVLAVSPDGREVYVQAAQYLDHQRLAPDHRSSQPDSEDSLAVYDVSQGTFTRRIPLQSGGCGVAEIFVQPDGRLVVFCPFLGQVRLVDPKLGRQVGTIDGISDGMAALTADDRRLLVVDRGGYLREIDLGQLKPGRNIRIAPANCGSACIPYQTLHLSADASRLFVRAAPGRADLVSTGHATVEWVIDTSTLRLIREVPLSAPAFDSAPLPDGTAILASNTNTEDPNERASRLIEVLSGHELARWPGGLVAVEVRSLPASASQPPPAGPLAAAVTATP